VYQYINGSYVLQKNLTFTEPGRYNGYYIKVSGSGDRIFVGDTSGRIQIYYYSTGGNLSLYDTITVSGWTSPNALQVSEDGLTMAVDMLTSSQRTLIYRWSGTWSLSHTIQHNQFQQDGILMTYDASYILLVPCGFVYKKHQDFTYKFTYNLPNDMSAISYTGDFIYNSTLSSSNQLDVLKKETTQIPVEMNGRMEINILKDSVYTDEGVIVRSDYSLDSTVSTVNNTEFGTYTVTYTASENSNVATALRKVTVSPLEFNNLNYILERFESYVEQGANLLPGYELTIDTSNVTTSNTTNVGTFDVVYTATNDTTGHEHVAIRQISVVDTTPPSGSIANPSYQLERFAVFNDPGVENLGTGTYLASTDTRFVDNTLPHNSTFDVIYDLGDDVSNTYLTRTVTVFDITPINASLIGDSSITIERNSTYVDQGVNLDLGSYIANDYLSNVDTSISNNTTFDVVYDIGDGNVYHNVTLIRTVTVIDTIPPIITIIGDNPLNIKVGDTYVERSVTYDQGSYLISTVDNINVNLPGTYTVVYTIGDDVFTSTVTRTVNVDSDLVYNSSVTLGTNYTFDRCDSMGMSYDGSRMVVNNYFRDYFDVYVLSNGSWVHEYTSPALFGITSFSYPLVVSISPDGNTILAGMPIANSNAGQVAVYKYTNGSWGSVTTISGNADEELSRDLYVGSLNPGTCARLNYSGTRFAINYTNGVKVYDLVNGSWSLTQDIQRGSSWFPTLSPDGNTLAVRGGSNVVIYELSNGTWSSTQTINYAASSIGVSNNGTRIAFSSYLGQTIAIYDKSDGTWSLSDTITIPSSPKEIYEIRLAMSHDGNSLAVCNRLHTLAIGYRYYNGQWNASENGYVGLTSGEAVTISGDGNIVAVMESWLSVAIYDYI
jgi:hypothetical protein